MRLFWRQGYEATSIGALTQATGLNRSSLYNAWGDKRGLFLAAVERYAATRLGPVAAALDGGGPLRSDLLAFYAAVADLAEADGEQRGCLISCALADAAGPDPEMREELRRRFDALEARLAARLEAARPGKIAADVPPAALASVLAATARGMMLRARAGAPRTELETIGRTAATLAAGPG
ncbi:MAG: TetR/AcrR family transcriptional regulator [Pseudomonadota bacterium]